MTTATEHRYIIRDDAIRFRSRLAQNLWDTEQFYQAMNEWRTLSDGGDRGHA